MKLCLLKASLMPWLCAFALAQASSPAEQAAMKSIRPEAIRAHMRFLSDSLLQGRGTGTAGYQIAARERPESTSWLGLKLHSTTRCRLGMKATSSARSSVRVTLVMVQPRGDLVD
ncbi:MAG: hypothetical protein ABSG34_18970 [Candidatus Sulfotelmatobacter sp.]